MASFAEKPVFVKERRGSKNGEEIGIIFPETAYILAFKEIKKNFIEKMANESASFCLKWGKLMYHVGKTWKMAKDLASFFGK